MDSTTPTPPPTPPGEPSEPEAAPGPAGRRRLDRAPGERFADRDPAADDMPGADVDADAGVAGAASLPGEPSAARGVALGLLGALVGAALIFVLAGPLEFTVGFLFVAYFLGRIAGVLVRAGAGPTLSPEARTSVAIIISVAGIGLAQVAIWLYARSEGGALPLVEYIAERYGPLVVIETFIAAGAAWWSSR